MKMKAIFGATCILLFAMPSVLAQGDLFSGPELDFFRKYMIDREFVIPADANRTSRLDGGKIEIDFDRRAKFANLTVAPEGFTYNVMFTMKQTNYDLDANGNRILPGRVMDRTVVVRESFGRSKSTGKMIGHRTILYNDFADASYGMASNMIMSLEGEDKMVVVIIPGGYADYFAAGGGHRPRTNRTHTEIVVKDGKVTRTSVVEIFDVDPDTLQMTPSGEKSTLVDFAELGEGR